MQLSGVVAMHVLCVQYVEQFGIYPSYTCSRSDNFNLKLNVYFYINKCTLTLLLFSILSSSTLNLLYANIANHTASILFVLLRQAPFVLDHLKVHFTSGV